MYWEVFTNLSISMLPKKYPPNQRDLSKAEAPKMAHILTSVDIEYAAHIIHRFLVCESFFLRFRVVVWNFCSMGFCFTLRLVTLLCLTPILLGGDPLGFYPEEDQTQIPHRSQYTQSHTPLNREPATISHLPLQSLHDLHRLVLV